MEDKENQGFSNPHFKDEVSDKENKGFSNPQF